MMTQEGDLLQNIVVYSGYYYIKISFGRNFKNGRPYKNDSHGYQYIKDRVHDRGILVDGRK